MKNIFSVFLVMLCCSCGNNTKEGPVTDSANAIEDHPLQDTDVAPFPDGYAPPNADKDTSQQKKDSIQNAQQH